MEHIVPENEKFCPRFNSVRPASVVTVPESPHRIALSANAWPRCHEIASDFIRPLSLGVVPRSRINSRHSRTFCCAVSRKLRGFAGELAVPARRHRRGLLMAHVDQADLIFVFAQGFVEAVDAVTRQPEGRIDAPFDQAFNEQIGCGFMVSHGGTSANEDVPILSACALEPSEYWRRPVRFVQDCSGGFKASTDATDRPRSRCKARRADTPATTIASAHPDSCRRLRHRDTRTRCRRTTACALRIPRVDQH